MEFANFVCVLGVVSVLGGGSVLACEQVFPFREPVPMKAREAFIDFDRLSDQLGLGDQKAPPRQACEDLSTNVNSGHSSCIGKYSFEKNWVVSLWTSNFGHRAIGTTDSISKDGQKMYFDRQVVDGKLVDYFITPGLSSGDVFMLAVEGSKEMSRQQRFVKLWPTVARYVFVCK